ncbi:MAG: O-antigen ligase family protein [Hyphomicrobiales bacterium]
MNPRPSDRSPTGPEIWLIALIVFCLPLFEAPKNVFGVVLVITFLAWAARRGFGRGGTFEWPIIGLILVLWLAGLTSEYQGATGWYHGELNLFENAVRWSFLGIVVLTTGRYCYTDQQVRVLWVVAGCTAIISVADALIGLQYPGLAYPEIRSIGHVNPSGLYVLVAMAVGLGIICLKQVYARALGMAVLLAAIGFILPSRSIVTLGAATTLLAYAGFVIARRTGRIYRVLASVTIVVTICTAGVMSPYGVYFRSELQYRISGTEHFSYRDKILYTALEVWERNPLFGSGFNSFDAATDPAVVRAELEAEGRDYDDEASRFFKTSHGHNLWTNALIERGLVGVVLYTVLLALYIWYFWRAERRIDDPNATDRMVILTSQLVVIGFIVGGLGNTTMQNEHGQAGMMMLAIAAGYLRGRMRPANGTPDI